MAKHTNIIDFLSGSIWLTTPEHMDVVARISNSILAGKNDELRDQFLLAEEPEAVEHGEISMDDRNLFRGGIKIENGVADIPLRGTIGPKFNMMSALSGGVSTELLTSNIRALTLRDDVHTFLLDIDSNGGSVHGIEAVAIALRAARAAGKRVYSFAGYNMNSAAYWIGSAADKIFATPTSIIGSIGAIFKLEQASKEDQERMIIIRSVEGKANVNPFEPLSKKARKRVESQLDSIHASFVEAVSLNRNISMAKAKSLATGEVEMGQAAVDAELADELVDSKTDILAQIEADENLETRFASLKTTYLATEQEKNELVAAAQVSATEIEALTAKVDELTAKIGADAASVEAAEFEALVDAAIDDRRIAAGLKEEWMADFKSGDVSSSAFERMVGNISPGTVVPTGELQPKASTEVADPLAPANDTERAMFAMFPSLSGKYKV